MSDAVFAAVTDLSEIGPQFVFLREVNSILTFFLGSCEWFLSKRPEVESMATASPQRGSKAQAVLGPPKFYREHS